MHTGHQSTPCSTLRYTQAERRVAEKKCDHEYAGITGVPELCDLAADLVFGADSSVLKANRVRIDQRCWASSTGACAGLYCLDHKI